jgi:hypothetical protein
VESRHELVRLKKDVCHVDEKTAEEKSRIIAENREKIMVEIREIELKLVDYRK